MTWMTFVRLGLGLALFLYGVSFLERGLQTALGTRLETWLRRAAATPLRGILLGTAVTAAAQSSSAVTVLTVGLTDTGVLSLRQAAAVIVGANLGTTATAWLIAAQLSGSGLEMLSPLMAVVGLLFWIWGRGEGKRGGGMTVFGLAVLLLGLEKMTAAAESVSLGAVWPSMLRSPWLGLALGAASAALLQSSSAGVGMLQSLTLSGTVSLGAALPIVLGENIGTCLTALLSAIPGGRGGRLAAAWHLGLNAAGSLLCLALYLPLRRLELFSAAATPLSVAALHTAFNLVCALAAAPLLYRRGKAAAGTLPRERCRKRKTRLFEDSVRKIRNYDLPTAHGLCYLNTDRK